MVAAWQHLVITWGNVDFLTMENGVVHLTFLEIRRKRFIPNERSLRQYQSVHAPNWKKNMIVLDGWSKKKFFKYNIFLF